MLGQVFTTDITDHFTLFACILNRKLTNANVIRKFRDCSDVCLERLSDGIERKLEDFHIFEGLGVNVRTNIFTGILWDSYNEYCPIRTKVVPRNRIDKPWFSDDLMRQCNIKHDLFRKYRNNEISFNVYNRVGRKKRFLEIRHSCWEKVVTYGNNEPCKISVENFDISKCPNPVEFYWLKIQKILEKFQYMFIYLDYSLVFDVSW